MLPKLTPDMINEMIINKDIELITAWSTYYCEKSRSSVTLTDDEWATFIYFSHITDPIITAHYNSSGPGQRWIDEGFVIKVDGEIDYDGMIDREIDDYCDRPELYYIDDAVQEFEELILEGQQERAEQEAEAYYDRHCTY